jgi:glucose/mannose-6-phosphate isomerase
MQDISPIDKENMYKELEGFFNQVRDGWKLVDDTVKFEDIDKIIISGMGGSALPGEMLKSYLYKEFKIPIMINRNYDLPEYADQKTLVIVSSYSGNTEETIESFRKANRKGCPIVVIAYGGKLVDMAKKYDKLLIRLPKALQPRLAYGYSFFAILKIFQNSGFVKNQDAEVNKLIDALRRDIYKKKGEALAEKLIGKIPLIYASEKLFAIAYKWKINFNENSKMHAFCNFFPELNHNEMVGYTKLNGNYYVIIIKDDYDEAQIKKRMQITKKIMQKASCPVIDIELTGTSELVKLFSTIYLGDWTSYFLAIKNETDPTPVDLVEDFKKEL